MEILQVSLDLCSNIQFHGFVDSLIDSQVALGGLATLEHVLQNFSAILEGEALFFLELIHLLEIDDILCRIFDHLICERPDLPEVPVLGHAGVHLGLLFVLASEHGLEKVIETDVVVFVVLNHIFGSSQL